MKKSLLLVAVALIIGATAQAQVPTFPRSQAEDTKGYMSEAYWKLWSPEEQARIDAENAPKKEAKPKKEDPEAEAKRAKREEQKQALHAWLMENLTDEAMTTTDIQGACPEVADVSVMQVGSWMTAIAKEDPSIQRDVVKGKPYYSKV